MPTEVLGSRLPGGLVGQQDQRPVDEGPGDRHPLLLAAGQLVGEVVALLGQADQVEDLRAPATAMTCLGRPMTSRAKATFSYDRLVGQQLEVLEDAADVAAQVAAPSTGSSWPMSLPATQMRPPSGSSSLVSRRRKVDLPEPDGPDEEDELALLRCRRRRRGARRSMPLYDLVTFSSRIMSANGASRGAGTAGRG